jgi:UDPglucose 6-dehydrogenase
LFNNLHGKKIAVLGFAFKKNTSDVRESPAIAICKEMLDEGCGVTVYDPKVSREVIIGAINPGGRYGDLKIEVSDSVTDALNGSDAAVVITDWDEFKAINWEVASKRMVSPAWIFDTRNCLEREQIEKFGLRYWAVGRSA